MFGFEPFPAQCLIASPLSLPLAANDDDDGIDDGTDGDQGIDKVGVPLIN